MEKNNRRWYEKNEYLSAFMGLLENLSLDEQCDLAIDLILRISSVIDRDYLKMIQDVTYFDPKKYKRWYDRNPNLHLAIESLRDLDPKDRDIIIQEFCDRILNSKKEDEE